MATRLNTINPADASGKAAELFGQISKAMGKVPNAYATIGTNNPEALAAMLDVDAVIASSTLDKADREAIRLIVSETAGCDYCIAAHTMLGKKVGLSQEAMKQIRAGVATGDAKRDALVTFVRTLATTRGTVPLQTLDALLSAGYTERQVIETMLVVASITFTNVVNRVNDTTLDFPPVE
ncbi:putative peroxidase-related enzyme [Paraburkholderia sp. BL6669N2]|uniref:carboxymuconolactone decarboxylase family protein n=1 Tax=Paraburkholderia sp. BL6669N2 TaxID=1938807 RepID=UPI000E21F4D2|nr:carboxymuconolactone decarboxylase family protein [Paraburkholderia sp. BL6669N2]REG49084.1 putative peroxidase-related enzyme [Paraburkholderia sp. BL6669N2]